MDVNIENFALTLFGEARGEPIEGIVAVASSIRNRLQLQYRGAKTYTDVCRAPAQYSCWNTNDPNYATLMQYKQRLENGESIPDIYFRQCLFIAQGIADWALRDNTRGATHYLSTLLLHSERAPLWAINGRKTAEIGAHTFIISN